jgi:hypothetical protein
MFLKNCRYVGAPDHELNDSKLLARTLSRNTCLMYCGAGRQNGHDEPSVPASRTAAFARSAVLASNAGT